MDANKNQDFESGMINSEEITMDKNNTMKTTEEQPPQDELQ